MSAVRLQSTKRFSNLPCAHRTHNHDGHCRFVHGYSRSFKFYFEAESLDARGFVVDFSGLGALRAWLEHMFDHTLLISASDPELGFFQDMDARGLCQLRVLPAVSMEGTARFVYEHAQPMIHELSGGRAWIAELEVWENDKNSGRLLFSRPE
ncbi:6-carboxytetrahydropterin synthase [Pseudenhygromyxa sp. WMMC2535]|uniref:6-pyruvoyl trahydropterin synthase family protein n=1 Tax=Pseudenhygromyxa sp. WMMC2535 TaxID=2712867 RepID=UPI001C3D10FC